MTLCGPCGGGQTVGGEVPEQMGGSRSISMVKKRATRKHGIIIIVEVKSDIGQRVANPVIKRHCDKSMSSEELSSAH